MQSARTTSLPAAEDLVVLRSEHESLDLRLGQLDRHLSLSPEEQYEKQVIKKRKLVLKDRIAHLEE